MGIKNRKRSGEGLSFAQIAYPPNFLRELALKFCFKTKVFEAQTLRPIGLRICSKYGKIPMLRFRLLIYFLSYT